ncbi:proline synthase co-transcribed bacterial-like protein -like [Micractinium conductrix]|uniref:Pyridoxal phosphate homeostasis protein n=1 Tax=Micractinium conductrix TaxID=554055 RepID=A0A2P6V4L0_9CHLO|nr:proline synthase co-transcribed bacterial-like protein -like [Micractinium conductrix]|eukprot:PSC69017.1 proline synthase co-transcribed bacterial-like protein -like [Micractinium conductrix]
MGSEVAIALADVRARLAAAAARAGRPADRQPRLVAVSKTKPAEAVKEAYEAGQRDFGENYVQELVDKAPQLPADCAWHFIGHLQSNKVKTLLEAVPNLAMLETVDSEKLASKLDSTVAALGRPPLPVFVQVNTSGEESKYGVEPADCVPLAAHIHRSCQHLRVAGLMTIGMPDYSSRPENFTCLSGCRTAVCEALGLKEEDVELSMGMSGDFESAVEMGSTNVRVGSTIFGARSYPAKA